MPKEKSHFTTITQALKFFSREEYSETPAIVVWRMVEHISIEEMTKLEVDWFTNIGLQLVSKLSKLDDEDLKILEVDIYDIAEKTDLAHKRFYP